MAGAMNGGPAGSRPLQRQRNGQRPRRLNRWLGLVFGVFSFSLLLATAGDIGLTYDEPIYSSRSFRAGEWLQLVFTAPSIAFERETVDRLWDATGDEQAGLVKLIGWPASMVASLFAPPLAAVRAATIFIVAVFIGLMFTFLSNIRGRLEATFACLGLVFMPRVFTHMHLLTMDAPVMAFSFLAIAAAYLAALHGPAQRHKCWLWIALLGLSFGAAISCKANGWFVPIIVLPWLFLVQRRAFYAGLVSMAVLGPLVFIGTWPWLWFDTGERIARYFSFFAKHYPVGVQYFGEVYQTAPWHYAPVMLAVTTPVVVLGLAVVGAVKTGMGKGEWGSVGGDGDGNGVLPRRCAAPLPEGRGHGHGNGNGVLPRRCAAPLPEGRGHGDGDGDGVLTPTPLPPLASQAPGEGKGDGRAFVALMVWAIIVNLGPIMLPSSPKYNGVRLFLAVFPPLVVLAGVGFGWLARLIAARLSQDLRERRMVLALLLLLTLAPQVYMTVQVHPFGMSYYNMLIGGLKGAAERGMEPTYWGDAYIGALPWLNEKAPQDARVWVNVPGFASSIAIYQQFGMLRPDLRLTASDEAFREADLRLVMNKPTELGELGQEAVRAGNPLYLKELDGVPLVWVFPGKDR